MKKKIPKGVIDLATPLKGYAGRWVILSDGYKKVLVSARTFDDLLKKGEKKKIRGGIMMRVAKPEDYVHYIGSQIK